MENKFTAIIVDDEPHALRTLEAQLVWTKLPIEVIGKANSVMEAELLLKTDKPDFLFLDIKMPGQSSFELFPMLIQAMLFSPQLMMNML
jgi:YesN/AraC family two-component response regulator